jgi:hypothetical protein
MIDERDEVIERVRSVLREAPIVDASAKARLLVAVAAERERTAVTPRFWSRPGVRAAAVSGLVAAALVVGWLERPKLRSDGPGTGATVASPVGLDGARAPASLARNTKDLAALRSVQLVFRDPGAHRVSVVGDFTEWDAHRAPMTRDSASGLWSVTVALRPGRHVYAFLVDDTIWVQDPRAMEAPDADFGRPGSVLLVGQP